MKADLTIIYYTDDSLPQAFAEAVRSTLSAVAGLAGGLPIVSVTQRQTIPFGRNVCVGTIDRSYRSILHQIREGCSTARTPFVALCEHDVIYPPEHFDLRPELGAVIFDQNRARALVDYGVYSLDRGGRSMQLVIADRVTLIANITGKLAYCRRDRDFLKKFEPGKGEDKLRLPPIRWQFARSTGRPILDICNHGGNYGKAKRNTGQLAESLMPWGTIADLCKLYHIRRER